MRTAYARLPARALALLHLHAVTRRARRYAADPRGALPWQVALVVADRLVRGEAGGR